MPLTALLIPPLLARIRAEERLLHTQFGDGDGFEDLAFGDGGGRPAEEAGEDGGDGPLPGTGSAVAGAKVRLKVPEETQVVFCYEAGRDRFYPYRRLRELGQVWVIDSASIDLSRKNIALNVSSAS